MCFKTKLIFSVLAAVLISPTDVNSSNWSRFVTTQNRDDVIISFRQKRIKNSWSVEWQVNNMGKDTVEPFLKHRSYYCDDDSELTFLLKTLGIYSPGEKRRGAIRDRNICPNSKIKLVEIETQINIPATELK